MCIHMCSFKIFKSFVLIFQAYSMHSKKDTMNLVYLILLLVQLGLSKPTLKFHKEWKVWKESHAKKYTSDKEEVHRHSVWLANRKLIEDHNKRADEKGFTLKMNHFGDMVSPSEEPFC